MTTRMVWGGRIVLAAGAAWLSAQGGVDPWIIGAAFGLVILAWAVTSPRELVSLESVAFAVSSALVCQLASWIAFSGSFGGWGGRQGRTALAAAMLAGTVLLPAAHAALLRASWRRAALATLGIGLTCLACVVVLPRVGSLSMGALAVIWQAAYLAFFFAFTPAPRAAVNPE